MYFHIPVSIPLALHHPANTLKY